MKMNKKGANSVLIVVISIVAIFVILVGLSFIPKPSDNSFSKFMGQGSQPLGEAMGLTNPGVLNWASYIFGEVPNFLIGMTSPYSAAIVTIGIFLILLLMFGDILVTFGTFGDKSIAWIIGTVLTIIAVNFKVTMVIAAFSLSVVAGLGTVSIALGIAMPFLIYLVLQFGLLKGLKQWMGEIQKSKNYDENKNAIKAGLTGMREIGGELRKKN